MKNRGQKHSYWNHAIDVGNENDNRDGNTCPIPLQVTYLYVMELMPTFIRTRGATFVSMFGYLGEGLAALIVHLLVSESIPENNTSLLYYGITTYGILNYNLHQDKSIWRK